MAKGIRVNQLAKELGVASKAILDKCRDEGVGQKVPNHMSVLSLGLAETIREWFHAGSGGTAVETAAPVDLAVKVKPARRGRKKAEEVAGVAVVEAEAPTVKVEEEEKKAEEPKRKLGKPTPRARVTRKPPEAAEPVVKMPVELPPAVEAAEAAPAAGAIAAEAPSGEAAAVGKVEVVGEVIAQKDGGGAAAAVAPSRPPGGIAGAERPTRPTITLASRLGGGAATLARKPVVPAPKLLAPAPAQMKGPRLVREEAPEVLPRPRAKRPGVQGPAEAPAFSPARVQGGRGVKVADDDEDTESKKKGGKGGRTLSARRRGPDGRRGEALEKLKEYTEADLIERRDRLAAAGSYRTGFEGHLKKSTERGQHAQAKPIVQRGEPVEIEEPITVKSLSASLGIKSGEIIGRLMKQGVFATINQGLEREAAEMIALEYGIDLQIVKQASLEQELETEFEQRGVNSANLAPRPPVVTILGHVDHGKTSLLDRIRHANVAAGEAGGITQHTAAWMVELGEGARKKRVTFIDTPGHQAFTSMRARGADMTDVVVLVVSAAEGVQPQTIESINHARAAQVPIVVALNKMDRQDANVEMTLGQLAKEGLNPVEWGGETEVIRTSATTGQGIEELIGMLDYQAELLELKADPTAPARGVVIEARIDEGLGAVATVLVQDGTLRVGDIMLCGASYGRIRSLSNDRGQSIQEATASMPVIVSGLDLLPDAGDRFYAMDDLERTRAIAEERSSRVRQEQLFSRSQVMLEDVFTQIRAEETRTINLIIKADVQGSVETLIKSVTDFNTEEVKVKVIHAGVGAINESDVELAAATRNKGGQNRVAIIGFHVVPEEAARALAERYRVDVKVYRVIYEIFDDLKKALSGMLEPEIREKLHGHAEIRQIFKVSKVGNIAGCMVSDGHIQRGSRIRLIRNAVVIVEDLALESLKRVKDDVREVKAGLECGLKIAGYDDIKLGDVLEAYVREKFERTL